MAAFGLSAAGKLNGLLVLQTASLSCLPVQLVFIKLTP